MPCFCQARLPPEPQSQPRDIAPRRSDSRQGHAVTTWGGGAWLGLAVDKLMHRGGLATTIVNLSVSRLRFEG